MNRRAFILAAPLLAGCAIFDRIRGGLILSTNGIDEDRVRGLAGETARRAGQDWPDFRLTVNATKTGRAAWSATYGRPVATFDDGACGWASGTRKSGLVRLALMPDGFIPDEYIIHELAHALRLAQAGTVDLPVEWKPWVLGWHP